MKRCPICPRLSPADAWICVCGHEFDGAEPPAPLSTTVLRRRKRRSRRRPAWLRPFLIGWTGFSLLAGAGLTHLPWGDPTSREGIGLPFAEMEWEVRSDQPRPTTHAHPSALLLNSACLLLPGLAFAGMVWFRTRRRVRG